MFALLYGSIDINAVVMCRDSSHWSWMKGMEAEASGNLEAAAEKYTAAIRGTAFNTRTIAVSIALFC
jgi:hypothetical protein